LVYKELEWQNILKNIAIVMIAMISYCYTLFKIENLVLYARSEVIGGFQVSAPPSASKVYPPRAGGQSNCRRNFAVSYLGPFRRSQLILFVLVLVLVLVLENQNFIEDENTNLVAAENQHW